MVFSRSHTKFYKNNILKLMVRLGSWRRQLVIYRAPFGAFISSSSSIYFVSVARASMYIYVCVCIYITVCDVAEGKAKELLCMCVLLYRSIQYIVMRCKIKWCVFVAFVDEIRCGVVEGTSPGALKTRKWR